MPCRCPSIISTATLNRIGKMSHRVDHGGKKQAMMYKLQYVQAFLMVIANVILIGNRLLQGLKLIMES